MIKMVKDVFLFIMGVTVAMFLYLALFGTYDLDGNSLVGTKTGNVTQAQEWKGAIWYMARSIESPISRYYYQYCYLPNVHQNDYVDEDLGGIATSMFSGDIQKTTSDLSSNGTLSSPHDFYTFSSGTNGVYYYTTGWK